MKDSNIIKYLIKNYKNDEKEKQNGAKRQIRCH